MGGQTEAEPYTLRGQGFMLMLLCVCVGLGEQQADGVFLDQCVSLSGLRKFLEQRADSN